MDERRKHNKITIGDEFDMIMRKIHGKFLIGIAIVGVIIYVAMNAFSL